jgi:hypothetical protein
MTRRSICIQILFLLPILAMALLPISGGAAQAMVICSNGQQTILYVDASGAPVDPLAPCDCLACDHCLPVPVADLGRAAVFDVRRDLISVDLLPARPAVASRVVVIDSLARGPPAREGLI